MNALAPAAVPVLDLTSMRAPARASAAGIHTPRMQKDEWLTPPSLLRTLGRFDLDPCSPVNRPWDTARHHYTAHDDGLKQPWFGRVFLNPPYGASTGKWIARLAAHGDGVALIFARTETRMFFDHVWPKADAILFIRGRLHFHHIDGRRAPLNSGAPSCLIAFGQSNIASLREVDGHLVNLRDQPPAVAQSLTEQERTHAH